jgi:putative NADPH-quinone reductase
MKTLVIITHPNLEQSRVNRTWMEELKKHEEITIHTLYQAYPDGKINVAHEQSLLETHDRIILQFPFYWYSTPSQKNNGKMKYFPGWAYGEGGTSFMAKNQALRFQLLVQKIPADYNNFTMETLTTPLQQTSNLIGTNSCHYL